MKRRTFLKLAGSVAVVAQAGLARAAPLERLLVVGKPVDQDLFVLLPGITGSELYVDGKPVWSPRASAVWDALTSLGKNLERLKLAGDSADADDLKDGVTVGGIIPDIHLIPGLEKIDGYSGIRDKLVKGFDLKPGQNYFEFAYDWRRDNRVAAKRLAKAASGWLAAWRKARNDKEARLILVCHSMGGLVARYYLEVLEGWRDTRAVITLGTPFRGSVKALNYVANGYAFENKELASVTELLRSFTSIYQLLPIENCCYAEDSATAALLSSMPAVANLDAKRAADALRFHEELRAAAEKNAGDKDYRSKRYEFCPIVGIGQPTAAAARISAAGLKVEMAEGNSGGDGTVSKESANPPLGEPLSIAHFVHEFHGSLQNNDAVWWQLNGTLLQLYTTPNRKFLRTPDELAKQRVNELPLDPGIEIGLADAYPAGGKIDVRLRRIAPEIDRNVDLSIAAVNSGKKVSEAIDLGKVDEWHSVSFKPLPAGAYRCSASGSWQSPGFQIRAGTVTDVFLVV